MKRKPVAAPKQRTSTVRFSHLDESGTARMVHVGLKRPRRRRAVAVGALVVSPATVAALRARQLPKGDVLAVARVAAIQAVKRTADLVPLCHPLPIEHVEVGFAVGQDRVAIRCAVATTAKTGVEMEALAGVSIAALTLYDMCKAVDASMRIEGIQVMEKTKA